MIKDVQVIPLIAHMGDRGYLIEIVRKKGGPESHSVVHQFGQVYLVGNMGKGTLRAILKESGITPDEFLRKS